MRAEEPGRKFRDCAQCPEMIVIPPGKFIMTRKPATDGRQDEDPEGIPKSAPAREVSIERAFAIGTYDITVDEYTIFVKETAISSVGCYIWRDNAWVEDGTKSWRAPGFRQSGRDPVVCVNWEDTQAYVSWLNRRVHSDTYRLPSWNEAEYAARAGATSDFYWGSEPGRDWANYGADRCLPCQPARQGKDRWLYTSPVGSFPPNAFGLYDMAGNVWQWMEDCLRREPDGLRWGPPAPKERCNFSPIRGGSWLVNPEYIRIGGFASSTRANRNQATGFRVARTLIAQQAIEEAPTNAGSTTSDRHAPGVKFRDCPLCPQMIVIPRGEFAMGSLPSNETSDNRESPRHEVVIPKAFAAGIYDVTRAEYQVFAQETNRVQGPGCNVGDPMGRWITDPGKSWRDPGFDQTDSDPVVCVSWQDAQAYVGWLNTKLKPSQAVTDHSDAQPYRLLTEAEWEYAARGGTDTAYYWGKSASHDFANFGLEQCYPCGVEKEGKDQWYYTSPVGSFAPNAFGLYDMLGNVWQWTEDCMHYGYIGAPTDGTVWAGGECKLRVLRGGSWLDPSRFVTVTLRNPWGPENRNHANGFRVARSLD